MRLDIVPSAVSREYELSDHRGMRRTLSELQEDDPLVLVAPCGGFCEKDRRQHEGLLQPPPRDPGRLLPPRDDLDRQRHRDQWVSYCGRGPGGRFSRTPAADCRRIATSRNKPTQHDDAMVPHHAGARARPVYKIHNGYWFFARARRQGNCATTCATCSSAAVPTGHIRTAEQRTLVRKVTKRTPTARKQAQVFALTGSDTSSGGMQTDGNALLCADTFDGAETHGRRALWHQSKLPPTRSPGCVTL